MLGRAAGIVEETHSALHEESAIAPRPLVLRGPGRADPRDRASAPAGRRCLQARALQPNEAGRAPRLWPKNAGDSDPGE